MFICKYCGEHKKNKNSLIQHEIRCIKNDNRLKIRSNFIEYNEKIKNKKIISNKIHKCKYCGKEFDNGHKLGGHINMCNFNPNKKEIREKISKKNKGKRLSIDHKRLISKAMKKAIKDHPESYSINNVSGRVKTLNYKGYKLKGSWELDVAKFLDNYNIKWTNIINEEILYSWKGKKHRYFPDFYLEDFNIYVEVKGYQRDRDLAKWNVY